MAPECLLTRLRVGGCGFPSPGKGLILFVPPGMDLQHGVHPLGREWDCILMGEKGVVGNTRSMLPLTAS